MRGHRYYLAPALVLLLLASGCRKDESPTGIEVVKVEGMEGMTTKVADNNGSFVGAYLLNNGGAGNLEAMLDYVDFEKNEYIHNVYAQQNSNRSSTLGDRGVDLALDTTTDRLLIVLQGSHKVVALEASTTKFLYEVPVNDPSSVLIDPPYFYVTSMVGKKRIEGQAPRGHLHRFLLEDGQAQGSVSVGCQPTHAILDPNNQSYIYVANSGEYNAPDYDHTISVIARDQFIRLQDLEVAPRPHRLALKSDDFWVSCEDALYRYTLNQTYGVITNQEQEYPGVVDFTLSYDVWDILALTGAREREGGIIHRPDGTPRSVTRMELTDGMHEQGLLSKDLKGPRIVKPISILTGPGVNLWVLDAREYGSSGAIHFFEKVDVENGLYEYKWSANTGLLPWKIAFVRGK